MPRPNINTRSPAATGASSPAALTDQQVIQACLAGDEEAWREFVTRFGRLIYSIPHRYGFDQMTCEEVFQNVFEIILKQLPKLREHTTLPKWLITTTHRECWRLTEHTHREEELRQSIPDPASPPLDAVIRWERQHLIRLAVRQLGGTCEALLTAMYLSQTSPSYDDLASQLGIPVASIGPTRARCLEKLLQILKDVKLDED